MRNDLTDITMIVDRSGSMGAIRTDAEGGINFFIEQQKQEPCEAVLTLLQFNTNYEFVHSGTPIKQVSPYRLQPTGSTALLDAVGRAVNATAARLAAMHETQRPGLVVVVIVTDGHENASREFNRAQIRQMIEHQQSAYKWQFTFLAANQDAFSEGASLGISADGIAQFTAGKVHGTYDVAAKKLSRMRKAASAGETIDNKFTDQERQSIE